MPSYLSLINWTDQGIRNVKDTAKRAEAVRGMAKELGISIKEFYWTLGQYDVAFVMDAPNDAAVATLGLSVGKLGNVRTQILPAFTSAEIGPLVGKMV